MNIKLRQLEAFKAIVEAGSVSEASVVLGLTQSSVSKLLASFETELGFLLFERVGRRLRLSEKGRLFLARTSNAMELLDDIRTTAMDIRDNQGRRLRICAIGPLAFSQLIPESVAHFSSQFPDFTYSLDMKLRVEIEDWILGGHSDLGLTLLPVVREQLRVRVFCKTQALAVVPLAHPLAQRSSVGPADLADHDIVMPKSTVRLRLLVEADFVKSGVPLRPRVETSNSISMVNLVAAGQGVAVVDPFALSTIDTSKVRVLHWEAETDLSYGAIWPATRELAPHEEVFLNRVEENAVALTGSNGASAA